MPSWAAGLAAGLGAPDDAGASLAVGGADGPGLVAAPPEVQAAAPRAMRRAAVGRMGRRVGRVDMRLPTRSAAAGFPCGDTRLTHARIVPTKPPRPWTRRPSAPPQ